MKKYQTIDHDYKAPSFLSKLKSFALKYMIFFVALMVGLSLLMLLPIIFFVVIPLVIMLFLLIIFFNKDHEIIRIIMNKYRNKK